VNTYSEPERPHNIDLGKTKITGKIMVSSAAIFYDEWMKRWQIETFIFSDDERQRTRQIIHGNCSYYYGEKPSGQIIEKCKRVHEKISKNLLALYAK
jgi:hypothetical protein